MIKLPPVPTDEQVTDELIASADKWAAEAHRGQYREFKVLVDGEMRLIEYIDHPRAVAALVPRHLKPLALLHDVVEDCSHVLSYDQLCMMFPAWITERLLILSRPHDKPYMDYITGIKEDAACTTVKLADLQHNMSDLKPCSLMSKYMAARQYLQS